MWRIVGQKHATRQLEACLRKGRLAHAYLLVGPPHVGKSTLALGLAQAVNCLNPQDRPCNACTQCQRIAARRHSDMQIISVRPEGQDGRPRKEIGIDEVRALSRQASLKPYEGRHRVYIFDGAEALSTEAANALLKTLEEPPDQVLLILVTAQEEALLPTIRSRCQRLELRPLPQPEIVDYLVQSHSLGKEKAADLARWSRGCIGWALAALKDTAFLEQRRAELDLIADLVDGTLEERFRYASELALLFQKDREEARQRLYRWLEWWRDLLMARYGAEELIQNSDYLDRLRLQSARYTPQQIAGFIEGLLKTVEALDHNANARLALELLMLHTPAGGRHP